MDPGLTRCGLAVVESATGRRAVFIAATVARTPASMSIEQRLLRIDEALAEWLDTHRPDAVAVEQVFSQHNLSSVMGTAQAAGLALTAAARRGISVGLHTPTQVKAAVTGDGRAEKPVVQKMVARILSLPELPRPADAADALALAICQLWRAPVIAGTATPAQQAWAQASAQAGSRSRAAAGAPRRARRQPSTPSTASGTGDRQRGAAQISRRSR